MLHLFAGYNQTPRGDLQKKHSDPATLGIKGLYIKKPLQKYSFVQRWFQENEYGQLLAKQIRQFKPDVVVSANTPLNAQSLAMKRCKQENARFIFWLQDLLGMGASRLLRQKSVLLATVVGNYYIWLEKQLLSNSDQIILITNDFRAILDKWRIDRQKVHVIPNWAPLESISPQSKENPWALKNDLLNSFCFIYSGTLGMKHNPELIWQLASHFNSKDVKIVVVSEGLGAQWLVEKNKEYQLKSLKILNFQPFNDFQFVLASSDVLIGILEPDAGIFSVPSKVLSYLCAKRAILFALPQENLAAKIIQENGAGIIVDPTCGNAFIEAAEKLFTDADLRNRFAENGREYAESHFNIKEIANKFEGIISSL